MHISATSLQLYWRCPELYRKVYISRELEREPQTIEMAAGTANHAGIDFLLKQKKAGTKLDGALLAAALTVAEGTLSTCVKQMIASPAHTLVGEEVYNGQVKGIVGSAITAFFRSLLPYSDPVGSEMPVTKPWELLDKSIEPVKVMGAIDWVENTEKGLFICDVKTSCTDKTPDRDSAARSFQLPFYAVMYERMYGVRPKFGALHHFVNSKRPHYTSRVIELTDNLLDATIRKVDTTIKAINAGIFPPGDAYFSCNESRCRAWLNCPMGGANG
jgi:hypothetical protein